jgi:enterochelin esterase-like enzyme
MKMKITLLVGLLVAITSGFARAQPVPADPAAQLQSPDVAPDHKVTLRLYAPKATAVTVAGEWTRAGAAPNAPEKLTREAQGIWSITVGPLPPNIYIYVFNVDGTAIPDPVNPSIKLRARGSASMVDVPAGPAATGGPMPWEFRDVPHGAVTTLTHQSTVLNAAMRQIVVYTPPGYDHDRTARTTRYPVLYLLHGTNDLAVGWTMAGRANLILDNLIADKKALPMIVVMPWGHALPFGARPAAGQPSNNDLFERYLLDEVMPLVEGQFRTRAKGQSGDRRARAVAGLSMGGSQAMQIGLGHRALFASVGVFGAGLPRAEFETRDTASAAAAAKNPIGLFYLGIGKEDGSLARARELSQAITARGFPLTYREVDGGHTYPTWRTLLVDLAPQLFRAPGAVKRPAL